MSVKKKINVNIHPIYVYESDFERDFQSIFSFMCEIKALVENQNPGIIYDDLSFVFDNYFGEKDIQVKAWRWETIEELEERLGEEENKRIESEKIKKSEEYKNYLKLKEKYNGITL